MSFSKPINFSFNSEEMNIIRAALGRMPHDDVQPIIVKIFQTVQDEVINKRSPVQQEEQPKAQYGYKADGTPRKRPGRPMKRARK